MHKMRKLNSSIDIIPLQGASGEEMTSTIGRSHVEDHQNRVSQDPLIISRVQMYLYENEDKVYIDVNEMADSLQKKYRDYRTKKRAPFRAMVRRAYDEITECFSKKSDTHSRQEDYDDDVEIESDTPGPDILNKEMFKMYKKNGTELIDISSDDESGRIEDIAPEKSRAFEQADRQTKPLKSSHSCAPPLKTVKNEITAKNNETHQKTVEFPQARISVVEKTKKRLRDKNPTEDDSQGTFKKKKSDITPPVETKTNFADIGGNSKVLEEVCRLLVHIKHPEIFKQIGISPPRGFLLHGPPGCGKSLLAHAIAGELDIPLIKVTAPELIGGVSGESESRIRELFERALASAPCVLFLDEIDAMAPHRATAQKEMERRMVAQLLSCLDDLAVKENGEKVLVLGATNRPDAMDPALRRAGRFDREVCLGIPDKDARARILQVHAAKMSLGKDVDLQKIAALSPGFVGADLVALLREAATAAVDRVFKELQVAKQKPTLNQEEPISKEDNKDKSKSAELELMETEAEKDVEKESSTASKANADTVEPTTSTAVVEIPTTSKTDGEEASDVVPEIISTPAVQENVSEDVDIIFPSTSTTVAESKAVITENPLPKVAETVGSTAGNLDNLLQLLHDKVPLSNDQLNELRIENVDFDVAFRVVQPSSKREGFATVPDVTWEDIGSLQEIREELQMAILAPVKHSENFETFGLNTPTGVLLCGPPGCGKTLLAKAIANEAEINFISVKGPELLNMYVGESEKAVRQCFVRARNSAPCVIFFDELDALCPKRSEGDNSATSRVVNQVLTEMDGVEGRKGVYLMAATNRPDIIDPAVLRPGRFDKILYVGLPTPLDRVDILKALTKNGTKPRFASDVSLEDVGRSNKCDGFTGADLAALVRESGIEALKESMTNNSGLTEVYKRHIDAAFNKVQSSVREKDIKHYEKLKKLYTITKCDVIPMVEEPVGLSPMDNTPIDTPMNDAAALEAMET